MGKDRKGPGTLSDCPGGVSKPTCPAWQGGHKVEGSWPERRSWEHPGAPSWEKPWQLGAKQHAGSLSVEYYAAEKKEWTTAPHNSMNAVLREKC